MAKYWMKYFQNFPNWSFFLRFPGSYASLPHRAWPPNTPFLLTFIPDFVSTVRVEFIE